jgi:hypothetical protein
LRRRGTLGRGFRQRRGRLLDACFERLKTFSVKVVGGLIDAFETPIAYLSAGFRGWRRSALRARSAATAVSAAFGAVINFIASGFERVLNYVIGA